MRKYLYSLATDKRKTVIDKVIESFLSVASVIYYAGVKCVLFAYHSTIFRSYRLNCRVISVGNITWGGTGKTPVVQMLAEKLSAQGKKVAVLTRGYGRDEYKFLEDTLSDIPVLADRNRLKAGTAAINEYRIDTVILDDGFQHWRLKRDIDLVVVNALNPFGNRRLIPRGILREPLNGLRRAGLFVITKTDLVDKQNIANLEKELGRINPLAPIIEAVHSPSHLSRLISGEKFGLEEIKNKKVAILSGIGDPVSFKALVERLGARVVSEFRFLDHYQYGTADLKDIIARCENLGIKNVITTEKDAVKLKNIVKGHGLPIDLFCLAIKLKITKGQNELDSVLEGVFSSKKTVLVLDDGRPGHLKQSLAVAREVPCSTLQIIRLRYKNRLFRFLAACLAFFASPYCRKCLRCVKFCLDKNSYRQVADLNKTPDIIISAGSGLVAINLILTRANEAKNVVLMKPGLWSFKRFSLVIVPEHDHPLKRENVLTTLGAPNLVNPDYLREQSEQLKKRLGLSKKLRIGLFVGGENREYIFSKGRISQIVSELARAAEALDAEVLATTSRRTSLEVSKYLKDYLASQERCKLLVIANELNPPQTAEAILGLSQIIVISSDSVSMISESLAASRYVIVFELDRKRPGAGSISKHTRLVNRLAEGNYLSICSSDNLYDTVRKVWREKRPIKTLRDNQAVREAVKDKLLNC